MVSGASGGDTDPKYGRLVSVRRLVGRLEATAAFTLSCANGDAFGRSNPARLDGDVVARRPRRLDVTPGRPS
jgi:hypothetical protein